MSGPRVGVPGGRLAECAHTYMWVCIYARTALGRQQGTSKVVGACVCLIPLYIMCVYGVHRWWFVHGSHAGSGAVCVHIRHGEYG